MSFSGDIKKEISRNIPDKTEAVNALIGAVIRFSGQVDFTPGHEKVMLITENVDHAKLFLMLIKTVYGMQVNLDIEKRNGSRHNLYSIILTRDDEKKYEAENDAAPNEKVWTLVHETCVKQNDYKLFMPDEECLRAYLRGAFLSAGSMSDPSKSYHLEFICPEENDADIILYILNRFDIEGKTVMRKGKMVVYLKDSAMIVDVLNIMEAHNSLLELENIRIIKDIKNNANRQFNCDSANINKMVKAATKQLDDIRYIQETKGLEFLPDNLYDMARVRMEHPDISLVELGAFLDPPVGKSGVNHRLKKISQIAEKIKLSKQE